MKTTSYTCDITETDNHAASLVIYTELQNGSTVFTLNERHSCSAPEHLGLLVSEQGALVDLVQEATTKDPQGRYKVDAWKIVGVKVRSV